MIYRYIFGNPIETDAVISKPEAVAGEEILYFKKEKNKYYYRLKEDDIIYGLGEQVRGINKRGWVYVSNCSDEPNHREDVKSLYGAHNFFIVCAEVCFGVFVDTPGKVTFDIGYTRSDELTISLEEEGHELYLITGEGLDDIVKNFRRLVGRSYIPPKWAFGFGQSRWSYKNAAEVREVARRHRDNHIPLDSIYLDIDYMERYKDFTIDREAFPDFEQLVEEMRAEGIRIVPIIDAGVKIEEGYETFEEGTEKHYFCKDRDGKDFVVGVWPGRCVLPDMLNDEARKWFGNQYQFLLDKGIEGFWNDMNEPALFYSEKELQRVFETIGEFKKMNLNVETYFEFQDMVKNLMNNPKDYQSFYHNYKGQLIRHDKVHNLFGFFMTRSAGEAFDRCEPDKRILMFSRASYIGMHRYGGVWMGDNMSWWSHLELNIKMLPSLNMCGFLYTGADLGGFGADTTEDLLKRWLAFGIFVPLMRNHAARGTRRQEAYEFSDSAGFRDIITLRYRLLPYLYSEFMKAALRDGMYCRPLGFVYPEDELARQTEDQLFMGESIMVAPVYKQNAKGRYVYCPEDMKMLKFKGQEVAEETLVNKGHHYIDIALDEVVVFIRKGYILPLAAGCERVDDVDATNLSMYHFASKGDYYELYDDDGYTKDVSLERNVSRIKV